MSLSPPRLARGSSTGPRVQAWARTAIPARSVYARWFRPVLGATLVALLIPPVAACVAIVSLLLVGTGLGPRNLLFKQVRAGKHGEPFTILKFRTLREDAEGRLVATRLGAVLRRTKFDELPQLWNVVRGDMSLIGPRPETLDLERWARNRVPGFERRLALRPGITGLAQVEQDSTAQEVAAYREKLRLNERYLERMSLGLDLWILLRTALRPLRPRRGTAMATVGPLKREGPAGRSLGVG